LIIRIRIVRYEFVPIGQTVNLVYYLEVLERLREKDGNDPNFLPTTDGSCITTLHMALSAREFVADNNC
jgi:hypothetical protein